MSFRIYVLVLYIHIWFTYILRNQGTYFFICFYEKTETNLYSSFIHSYMVYYILINQRTYFFIVIYAIDFLRIKV